MPVAITTANTSGGGANPVNRAPVIHRSCSTRRRASAVCPVRASPAGDVEIPQYSRLELHLVDPVFDDVTDTDQADQPAVVDDGCASAIVFATHYRSLDADCGFSVAVRL
jgi:hypothetical protein